MLFTWHFYNKVVLLAFHTSVKCDIAVFRGGDSFVVIVLVAGWAVSGDIVEMCSLWIRSLSRILEHSHKIYQTMAWVLLWCLSGILDVCLEALFVCYKEEWSHESLFWIWNLKGFAANEGVHIIIPFALSVPVEERSEVSSRAEFYVRKSTFLEPRRPSSQTLSRQPISIFVKPCFRKTISQLKKEGDRKDIENVHRCGKVTPLIEIMREEITLSIPNLPQETIFPSIVYCKSHQSYRVVKSGKKLHWK